MKISFFIIHFILNLSFKKGWAFKLDNRWSITYKIIARKLYYQITFSPSFFVIMHQIIKFSRLKRLSQHLNHTFCHYYFQQFRQKLVPSFAKICESTTQLYKVVYSLLKKTLSTSAASTRSK